MNRVSGFDAILGNPPWVLYVGKGKQPIDPREEALLKELHGGAATMLSTHGCFAARAATLTRVGGRVGLVMPTSLADAARYVDARAVHEADCEVESALPDFGASAFAAVFQPSFGLLSTKRPAPISSHGRLWDLERPERLHVVDSLIATLSRYERLPKAMFGERGYRSSAADRGKFEKRASPTDRYCAPLYEGVSVRELELLPPTAHADPIALPRIVRENWRAVDVLLRQTARYPIACASPGVAFRNSIIAAFVVPPWTCSALLAYLNSSLLRWLHFHTQRDARQGMPQVKVAHLRALPSPPLACIEALETNFAAVCARQSGITPDERRALDETVYRGFQLEESACGEVNRWAAANPPPAPRKGDGPSLRA